MKQENKSLFSQDNKLNDMMNLGSGFAQKKISERHVEIYSSRGFYKAVELKSQVNKRLLVVELINEHGVRKSLLAKSLKVSRQSIDKLESETTIALTMLNQWEVNENGFKHMGNRIHMHYNPVLNISEESQMQMLPNPRCKELKQKKNGYFRRN